MKKTNKKKDKLFKSVFCNIVLLRRIYYYVRKYRDNEHMVFEDLNSLKTYKDREFISSIEYRGSTELVQGDLPEHGVLKQVIFPQPHISRKGDIIPYGVEIIDYCDYYYNHTTPFSTLPTTIHTIKNAHVTWNVLKVDYLIPPNVTTISLINCPNISQNPIHNGFKIPNTIKHLTFDSYWNNKEVPLSKGDIPEGIISLTMMGYKQIHLLKNDTLPSTIKHLEIKSFDSFENYFDQILPSNIESLYISMNGLRLCSGFTSYKSIKCLTLVLQRDSMTKKTNLVPPSVTDLTLINFDWIGINLIPTSVKQLSLSFGDPKRAIIGQGTIPNGVKHLKTNKIITKNSLQLFPPSLTTFELNQFTHSRYSYHGYHSVENFNIMINIHITINYNKYYITKRISKSTPTKK